MKEFVKGESFKLKGCRKTWDVIEIFNYNGRKHCVAVTTLTNTNFSGIGRIGIFVINEDGVVYQRV